MSKGFHIIKKTAKLKKLGFKLTGGIMGEETASRPKFNSVPFYELCF